MRAAKRIRSIEERNRRVDDAAYRHAQNAKFIAQMHANEMREFVLAYDDASRAVTMTPQYMQSRAGVFFPIPYDVRLNSVKAHILQYYDLYVQSDLGNLVPIKTPFEWPPSALVYAYKYPPELLFGEDFENATRIRFM